MIELTEKQISEYYKRSYTAVDGLWFMKAEERYGFDTALDMTTKSGRSCPKSRLES